MEKALASEIGADLGAVVDSASPVSGGCISDAYRCRLGDGRDVFIKVQRRAPKDFFALEAEGLAWLAEAEALATPRVLGHGTEYLILEYMEPGPRRASYDEELGRGLARLHKYGASSFGWHRGNFLATLPQDNHSSSHWAEFYGERRLRPLLKRAIDEGHAPPSWSRRFDSLFARLEDLVGPEEAPARLHGDLWSGNLHCTPDGAPAIIDPAVYGGHREVDLAMLKLFGSPSSAMFRAYDEVYPRASGHEDRTSLYQLYPLLAHVALFGRSYVSSVEGALAPWC